MSQSLLLKSEHKSAAVIFLDREQCGIHATQQTEEVETEVNCEV